MKENVVYTTGYSKNNYLDYSITLLPTSPFALRNLWKMPIQLKLFDEKHSNEHTTWTRSSRVSI